MARLRRMIYQKGAVGHIFQRARSGFVVFYSVKDSLVFFTIFSLTAAKHRIRVLGLCLMYNHIHVLVEAEDHKTIARFMQELCSKFSKTYNIRHGLKGSLLSTYGLSNKRGGKQARTSLAYLNELISRCGVSIEHARKFLRIEAVEDKTLKHRR